MRVIKRLRNTTISSVYAPTEEREKIEKEILVRTHFGQRKRILSLGIHWQLV